MVADSCRWESRAASYGLAAVPTVEIEQSLAAENLTRRRKAGTAQIKSCCKSILQLYIGENPLIQYSDIVSHQHHVDLLTGLMQFRFRESFI